MIERATAEKRVTEGRGSRAPFGHLLSACLYEAWRNELALSKRMDVHRQRAT